MAQEIIYIPAWKDTFYQCSSSPATFQILNEENVVIYSGRAVERPGERYPSINIASIIRNYVTGSGIDFSTVTEEMYPNNADKVFTLEIDDTSIEYRVHLDWSYDNSIDYSSESGFILSRPINGHFDPRMYFLFSAYQVGSHPISWYAAKIGEGGGELQEYDAISTGTTSTFIVKGVESNVRKFYFENPENPSDNISYDKLVCGKGYALYYRNRYGGWDAFLIEGNAIKTDNYDKDNYFTPFNNNNPSDFGKITYHKDIRSTWTLHTGWLKDEESENLAFNLLPSPQVYLHDLEKDVVKAVNITNTTTTYKTYANQGHKIVNYEIDIEESQSQLLY